MQRRLREAANLWGMPHRTALNRIIDTLRGGRSSEPAVHHHAAREQPPGPPVPAAPGQVRGGSHAPVPRFLTRVALRPRLRAQDADAQRGVAPCPPRGGDARRAPGGGYVTALRSTMSPGRRGGGGTCRRQGAG